MLEKLLEGATDAIVLVDSSGTIVWANQRVEALLGWRPDELVGQAVEALVPAELHARHAEHRAAFANQPHARIMGKGLRLFAIRKGGSRLRVDISLSPLHRPDGLLVMAAIREATGA